MHHLPSSWLDPVARPNPQARVIRLVRALRLFRGCGYPAVDNQQTCAWFSSQNAADNMQKSCWWPGDSSLEWFVMMIDRDNSNNQHSIIVIMVVRLWQTLVDCVTYHLASWHIYIYRGSVNQLGGLIRRWKYNKLVALQLVMPVDNDCGLNPVSTNQCMFGWCT